MSETLANGKVTLHCGDMLDVLATLPEHSVDSVVTDPPYHLVSIVKRFGAENAAPAKHGTDGAFARASRGFMGKQWDGGDIAFRPETWRAVWRVLKPGGHVIAFSGTRTYHRMAVAIEDAGFEIRDQIGWAYGSGFPKSHNVGRAIDKHLGAEREKIRHKPRPATSGTMSGSSDTRPWIEKSRELGYHEVAGDTPATPEAAEWDGWGTALKPSWEPCVLARKPLIGSVAENVLAHGTGAINVNECRVGDEILPAMKSGSSALMGGLSGSNNQGGVITNERSGRWPANIIHDGSDEVVEAFPDAGGGFGVRGESPNWGPASKGGGTMETVGYGDSGSAARFFYQAKADIDDRLGSKHPTVKPIDLMQYLVRLVTPKGGVVLDCFAGTGTTGEAAFREGMRAVLIEREPEYQADIRRRMSLVLGGTVERRYAAIKARGIVDDAGPLFSCLDP